MWNKVVLEKWTEAQEMHRILWVKSVSNSQWQKHQIVTLKEATHSILHSTRLNIQAYPNSS